MKTATLSEIQKEITTLSPKKVQELCSRLIKYKKENKELLTYLLFEAHDEEAFINNIKEEVELQFREMNNSNIYLSKKSLRKILRMINKYIRYSGSKQTEVDLRIHYCKQLKLSGIRIDRSQVLMNLYNNQVIKINKALEKLHEDLQYDFQEEMKQL